MINLTRANSNRILKNSLASGVVVFGAAGLAILLAAIWLNPPRSELIELFLYLLVSGAISVVVGMFWLTYANRNIRLHVQLIATYLVASIIALVNIGVTASLMFLSAHDFNLLVLLVIFSSAISIFFGFMIAQQLTRQVEMLVEGAHQLAKGQLETRVKGGGSRELVELSQAFNAMAAQLQQAFEKQRDMERARKELVAAVGHDLRTPLASIRLMTEAICDGVTDEAQTRIFQERIRAEVIYMSGLIDDLFELSQLDAGALKIKCEAGNLADLISDTLESMRAQAEAKHQTLEGEIVGELPIIEFDHRKIQRVLNNLVGNAVKYTPEGGHIAISAGVEDKSVKVSVTDNGEGINSADLGHLFEPFYRGERSRGREHGGAGLGLAIAKGLAEAHGGSVSVESKEGQGSTFTLRLPI